MEGARRFAVGRARVAQCHALRLDIVTPEKSRDPVSAARSLLAVKTMAQRNFERISRAAQA